MFKLPKDFDPSKNLGRAQVIMNPILQLNMIRLNNEVTGHLAARYKGSGKKPGDIVTEDEVGEIQDFKLIKQDDDMSRQVVMIRIKGAWWIFFDLGEKGQDNLKKARGYLRTASDFYSAAVLLSKYSTDPYLTRSTARQNQLS